MRIIQELMRSINHIGNEVKGGEVKIRNGSPTGDEYILPENSHIINITLKRD